MKKILTVLAYICLCSGGFIYAQNPKTMTDRSTVSGVDLNKYLGKWYEIARFDHSFERGLVGTTATYSLLPDGKIRVVNEGFKYSLNGKHKVAQGKAKIPDPSDLSKLKVSFFLNFYADYLIMELDQVNYQYAMIGSSSDKYLWILSRTPSLPDELYDMLVQKAKKRGYNTEALIKVVQP